MLSYGLSPIHSKESLDPWGIIVPIKKLIVDVDEDVEEDVELLVEEEVLLLVLEEVELLVLELVELDVEELVELEVDEEVVVVGAFP